MLLPVMLDPLFGLVRFYLLKALHCKIVQCICKNVHLPLRVTENSKERIPCSCKGYFT